MALYDTYADAPKDVTSMTLDVTPWWKGVVRHFDVTDSTTTTATALTEAACIAEKGLVILAQASERGETNTTCVYTLENKVLKSYTFEKTVVITARNVTVVVP